MEGPSVNQVRWGPGSGFAYIMGLGLTELGTWSERPPEDPRPRTTPEI